MLRSRLVAVLIGLAVLVGCAGLSARHLPRQEWKSEATQTLPLRYLTFQYRVLPLGDEVGVVAEAYPDVSRLPDWASWYGEIVVEVYLTDGDGQVIESSESVLLPRPLDREAGLPVEARFDLGTARQQPLFVSFGYRLALTDGRPDDGAGRRVLVSEGALEQ